MIYVITSIVEDTLAARVFGYFTTLQDAKDAVRQNYGDLHECYYKYLVIEEAAPGIHPMIEKEWWYQWNSRDDRWTKCKKPKAVSNVFNFSVG